MTAMLYSDSGNTANNHSAKLISGPLATSVTVLSISSHSAFSQVHVAQLCFLGLTDHLKWHSEKPQVLRGTMLYYSDKTLPDSMTAATR